MANQVVVLISDYHLDRQYGAFADGVQFFIRFICAISKANLSLLRNCTFQIV